MNTARTAHALQANVTNVYVTPFTTSESIFSFPFADTNAPGTQNQLGYYYNVGNLESVSYTHLDVYKRQFNNRLTIEADYFNKDIDNLILSVPQAPSKGIPGNSILKNVGTCLLYTSRCV